MPYLIVLILLIIVFVVLGTRLRKKGLPGRQEPDFPKTIEEFKEFQKNRRPVKKAPTTVVKTGRNEPCWCGSGKKTKFCHPEAQANPQLQISDTMIREITDKRNRHLALLEKEHGANVMDRIVRAYKELDRNAVLPIPEKWADRAVEFCNQEFRTVKDIYNEMKTW